MLSLGPTQKPLRRVRPRHLALKGAALGASLRTQKSQPSAVGVNVGPCVKGRGKKLELTLGRVGNGEGSESR